MVVFLFELVTNKPTCGDNFFRRNAKTKTFFSGLRIEDKIVGIRREFKRRECARIGNDVVEGKVEFFHFFFKNKVVHIKRGNNNFGFLGRNNFRNFFLIRDFREGVGYFFNCCGGAKFKRYFEELGKKEVKGSVETKFFTLNKVEVG